MPGSKEVLTPEQKKRIEQNLISVFKDVYYNSPNILKAKSESEHISDEIRSFILGFSEGGHGISEADLLIKAKEKGLELIENHDLIFFDEEVNSDLTMRAFLIPGMKVEFTEENAGEKVTEDDLQIVDHELCISFKVGDINEFTKLSNLIDIRAALAKALTNKSKDSKETTSLIKENKIFKDSLKTLYESALHVLERESN